MSVPVTVFCDLTRSASEMWKRNALYSGKPLYVSELLPGDILNLFDGMGGDRVGQIDFTDRSVSWLHDREIQPETHDG